MKAAYRDFHKQHPRPIPATPPYAPNGSKEEPVPPVTGPVQPLTLLLAPNIAKPTQTTVIHLGAKWRIPKHHMTARDLLKVPHDSHSMPRTCWACDREALMTPWPVLHLIGRHQNHPTAHLPPQAYAWVAPWFHRTDANLTVAWNPHQKPKWLFPTTPNWPRSNPARIAICYSMYEPGRTGKHEHPYYLLDHSCHTPEHRTQTLTCRGRGQLPPPPPRPDKDFIASLCVVNGTLGCPPQEGPHPYRDLPGGFSRHLQDALFPPWIIRRGSMTAWEARIVGEEWARERGRWCAATRAPETPAQQYAAIPLEGWGPHTRQRPTMMRGAGPDHLWDAATKEWLQEALGRQTGWTGDVSPLVRAAVPPCIVLHAANVLRATEIHTWGHDAATIRWHPLEDGTVQVTVAHFKTVGPVYDDALSRLEDTRGPLLLMLPNDLAAALREELDSCDGLRVEWEAVADGNLLALLHRDAADECQWDMLAPHLTGRHMYVATPPPEAPQPGVGRPHRRLPRPQNSPRQHVAGGPAEDTRQGLPAPRPRPPAGDPGPSLTEVGRPLAPPSRPLVAALPPPTHLPPLRGMRHGVLRSADRRQHVHAVLPGGRMPLV